MKTIKITADNKISIIDIDFNSYKAMQEAVGGYVETISTEWMYDLFERPVLMLVDEDGYRKELKSNLAGSLFYDSSKYSLPIVGDIVLAQPAGKFGEDLEGIGEPEETLEMLVERFQFLERVN